MTRLNPTLCLALAALLPWGAATAQSFLTPDDVDANSAEGLQSATPTDSVNELNENGGGANGNVSAGFDDFENSPAQESGDNFNINSQESSGDDLFGDGAGNPALNQGSSGAANPTSAFSNSTPQNAGANANAKPANAISAAAPVQQVAPVQQAVPVNTVPLNQPVNQTAPFNQTAPANAQSLMNDLNAPANASGNAATTAVPPPEAVAPPPVAEPPIVAPELAAPNEFAGAPPIPGGMRVMAEGEAPEEYRVQPGDTLFDICDQLLDEGGYWPKLWALNPEIKNPHFIFPNMRLKFFPGDDETPPYLQVVTEDDVIPIDKGDLDEQELVAEKVDFSEEAFEEEGIIEVIGPDQVEMTDDVGDILELGGRIYDGGDIQVQVPGFIFGEEREALAYVIGGRSGEVSVAQDLQVLLEADAGVAAGTTYTVLRKGEEVDNPETGDFVGYKYYFVANVKVDRGVGDDVFIGTVQNSRLSVLPDDIVVSFISTMRSVPSGEGTGALSSTKANVVGFELRGQDIGGQGQYAFIDAGNGDGVSPGMYVAIYSTPGYLSSSFGDTDLPEDYQYAGVIRIIDTTDAGAVGYIVKNSKELRIGDRAGKG
jgi:hypothetical protein